MWDTVLTLRECMLKNLGMICLIHTDVWQKLTQYCKAIILQSKIICFKKCKKKQLRNEMSQWSQHTFK